jgi:anti-anti-sigma factor
MSAGRARDPGALHLVSSFLGSCPPAARLSHERRLASLDRVRKDGVLTVRVERDGRELVVRLFGDLDIASAKRLEDELVRATASDASAVTLDLGGLSFIDSTGLRVLVFAANRTVMSRKRFKVVHASNPVKEAWETAGLERAFPLGG